MSLSVVHIHVMLASNERDDVLVNVNSVVLIKAHLMCEGPKGANNSGLLKRKSFVETRNLK